MMPLNKQYQAAPMEEEFDQEDETLQLQPMNVSTDNGSLPRSIELSKRNIALFVILGTFLFGFSYYTGTNSTSPSWSPSSEGESTFAPSFRAGSGNVGNPDQVTPKPTDAPKLETSKPTDAPKVVTSKPTEAPKVTPKPSDAPKVVTSKPTEAPKVTAKPTEAPKTKKPTSLPTKSTAKPTDAPKPAVAKHGAYYDAMDAVIRTKNNLRDYYLPYGNTRMNAGWIFGEGDEHWETSQDFMALTIARAIVNKRTFITGGIGSSVMAGHDNCNYDSFGSQLERLMKPLFQKAGIDYEFRNAGEGGKCGDNQYNQAMCFVQNAGDDIDHLVYSWSYFEGKQGATDLHESLIRWGLMTERQHPISFLYMSSKKHVCMRGIQPTDGEVMDQYAKYGTNALCLDLAIHVVPDCPWDWNKVGDCLHYTTRYGLTDEGGDRKDSLGVLWRNWHPGPLGFEIASDSFGFFYMEAMLRAFKLIEAESNPMSKFGDNKKPKLKQSDLPDPLYCHESEWGLPCMADKPPQCLNSELPTYGPQGVNVVGTEDASNPFTATDGLELTDSWQLTRERRENMVPKQERKYGDKCKSLDACGFYETTAGSSAGTLSFRFPVEGRQGTVIICCSSKKCSLNIKPDLVEFKLGGRVIDSAGWQSEWLNSKCMRLMSEFVSGDVKNGQKSAYLGVTMKTEARLRFSHVIAF